MDHVPGREKCLLFIGIAPLGEIGRWRDSHQSNDLRAKRFGRECPEPDFDAARDYWPKRIVRLAQRHTGLATAAALGVALLLAGSVFAIRRHRQSATLQAKLAASSGLPVPE